MAIYIYDAENDKFKFSRLRRHLKFNLKDKRGGHLRKSKPDFIDSIFKIATWE